MPTPTIKKRRVQERAEITRAKLIETGLALFSGNGFCGVTIRDIETTAGVQRGLLGYHFCTRDALWKVVIDHSFELLEQYLASREEAMQALQARDQVAYSIFSFVHFSADHPQFSQLMVWEATRDDWRLRYIVENHTRPRMEELRHLAQQGAGISSEKFVHWYYLFVASSGLFFSLAPEACLLFDIDTKGSEFVDQHARFLVDSLLGEGTTSVNTDGA